MRRPGRGLDLQRGELAQRRNARRSARFAEPLSSSRSASHWRTSASARKPRRAPPRPQWHRELAGIGVDAIDPLARLGKAHWRPRAYARQVVAHAIQRRVPCPRASATIPSVSSRPGEPALFHDWRIGERRKPGAQRHQVAGEVAAVHGGT
jgi:hypothetical protein